MKTKTGEDITSKLGQPHPSNVRFLKAHLVDLIINVCMKEIGNRLIEIQPIMQGRVEYHFYRFEENLSFCCQHS